MTTTRSNSASGSERSPRHASGTTAGAAGRPSRYANVVSSGAIALGLPKLGLRRRPSSLARLQAASALGQARLQAAWEKALGVHGLPAAQILLAAGDVADRLAYVNARQAFVDGQR